MLKNVPCAWLIIYPVMTSFAPCKGIQDSLGFWIRRSGFRIPGNGFRTFSFKFGFRISIVSGIPRLPWAVVRIPKPRIQDSTSKNFLDSGIRTPLHGVTSCLTANCMVNFTSSAKHKLLKTFPWQRFCWRKRTVQLLSLYYQGQNAHTKQ